LGYYQLPVSVIDGPSIRVSNGATLHLLPVRLDHGQFVLAKFLDTRTTILT